jgi:hypothetical protein
MKPTVVVGCDQTPPSERALIEAGREAAWRGAALTGVTAFTWIQAITSMSSNPQEVEEFAERGAPLKLGGSN